MLPAKSRTTNLGPFGEVIRSTGSITPAIPIRWSTKYTDLETDLVYYGHRYYNPSTGRWLSRDRKGERASVNLYSLTRNSPVNFIDALGLEVVEPPKDLGFTLEDLDFAVDLAAKCKVKGPDGMSILKMYLEMKQSPNTVTWGEVKSKDKVPRTMVIGDSCNPKILFPKCNPKSGQPTIPGSDGSKFYFEAALLHELVHAYGRMTEKGALDSDAVRVGNELNDCVKKCLGQ